MHPYLFIHRQHPRLPRPPRCILRDNERKRTQDMRKLGVAQPVEMGDQRIEFVAQVLARCRVGDAAGRRPRLAHHRLPEIGELRPRAGEPRGVRSMVMPGRVGSTGVAILAMLLLGITRLFAAQFVAISSKSGYSKATEYWRAHRQ